MATPTKAQHINEIQTLLKKRYKRGGGHEDGRLTVLEAVVFAIAHEDATREQAEAVLQRFKSGFFDWNEVRVSTIEEIQATLGPLPDPEPRAQKVRRFLRQLFQKTYGFTLDALTKKPLKESLKALGEYEVMESDFVQASVTRNALGGHAIPVDASCRRALERLGLAEPGAEVHSVRGHLERAIPKNRGGEFAELIEDLAHDTCVPGVPDCPRCELKKVCPTGQARLVESKAAEKQASARAKAAAKGESAKAAPAPAPSPAVAPAPSPAPAPKGAKGAKGQTGGR